MKVYCSDKIAGLDEAVFRANFEDMEVAVLKIGHEPVNPLKVSACKAETCNPEPSTLSDGSYLHSWHCYLKYDLIAMLSECDAILMGKLAEDSRGATFECYVAEQCGLMVFDSIADMEMMIG